MQHLTNAISSMPLPGSSTEVASAPQAVPIRWIERLFERLAAILGARMADIVAGCDPEAVKREWSEALGGFTDTDLVRGIQAVRTRKFPPNLPEFLHLCRPALDPEIAWIEAEQGLAAHARHERFAWSHPAVYWSASAMQFEIRSGSFKEHRKRWEAVTAAEWRKGAWASPPDPTQRALPPPPPPAANPAAREAAIAKLRQIREELTRPAGGLDAAA